jgi:hypothetical protein
MMSRTRTTTTTAKRCGIPTVRTRAGRIFWTTTAACPPCTRPILLRANGSRVCRVAKEFRYVPVGSCDVPLLGSGAGAWRLLFYFLRKTVITAVSSNNTRLLIMSLGLRYASGTHDTRYIHRIWRCCSGRHGPSPFEASGAHQQKALVANGSLTTMADFGTILIDRWKRHLPCSRLFLWSTTATLCLMGTDKMFFQSNAVCNE